MADELTGETPVPDDEESSQQQAEGSASEESDAGETEAEESASPRQWYVLKVTSNREKSIKQSLERRIKRENLQEFFGEIVIPTEKVMETKGGKKRVREQKLFPGYMMIHMELNDDTWYLVRDTSGVGDFTGAAGKPIPMQPHEVDAMLGKDVPAEEADKPDQVVVKLDVSPGETVKVKEGPFENFEGTIDSIDEHTGKIKVMIEIFGRSTEVELEHWQVEKT